MTVSSCCARAERSLLSMACYNRRRAAESLVVGPARRALRTTVQRVVSVRFLVSLGTDEFSFKAAAAGQKKAGARGTGLSRTTNLISGGRSHRTSSPQYRTDAHRRP